MMHQDDKTPKLQFLRRMLLLRTWAALSLFGWFSFQDQFASSNLQMNQHTETPQHVLTGYESKEILASSVAIKI